MKDNHVWYESENSITDPTMIITMVDLLYKLITKGQQCRVLQTQLSLRAFQQCMTCLCAWYAVYVITVLIAEKLMISASKCNNPVLASRLMLFTNMYRIKGLFCCILMSCFWPWFFSLLKVKVKEDDEESRKDDTSFESSEGTGTPRSGSTTPGAQLGGSLGSKQPPKKRDAARSRSSASIESSRSSTPR